MFKQLLGTIKAKLKGGSTDKQGNIYSRQDDEKLAAKQTMSQQIRTANPQGLPGREQPRPNAGSVYQGVTVKKPPFMEALKKIMPQPKPVTKKVIFNKPAPQGMVKGVQAQEPTRMPTPTPTPTLKEWGNYEKYIADQARARGYHPGVIVSQKAIESARGQSRYAKERNNYGGVGAYDSNPDNAFTYASPEAYLDSYFKLIEKRYPKAYQNRKDPRKFARYLKEGGYASDPDYEWKLQNTPEFRKYSK